MGVSFTLLLTNHNSKRFHREIDSTRINNSAAATKHNKRMSAHAKKKHANNPYVNKPKLSTPLSMLASTDSAAHLTYAYRKLRQLPIEITREELEGGKLEEYIVSGLGAFCCAAIMLSHTTSMQISGK
jgi:hypothetical protein